MTLDAVALSGDVAEFENGDLAIERSAALAFVVVIRVALARALYVILSYFSWTIASVPRTRVLEDVSFSEHSKVC
jgi:hypothetical protein